MIIKRFEQQAQEFAEGGALYTGTRVMTYRELNGLANRMARKLTGLLSPEQTVVGLLLGHQWKMVAGILATLKAGKIYVPLEVTYPENRLDYLLTHAGASLILTAAAYGPLARRLAQRSSGQVNVLDIDSLEGESVSADSMTNIPRSPSGDRPAYILYTSGSTGKPKGVVQNHRNVCYYVDNWIERFSITPADRLTLFSSFSHDGAGQDMFGALLAGARLYPYNVLDRTTISRLAQWLREEEITHWHSVPTLFRYFVSTLGSGQSFPRLRFILLGGEQLRRRDLEMFQRHFPNTLLANIYGQTESSVNSTWVLKPDEPLHHISIGEPLSHTTILILDENDEVVEDVGVGEILAASPHLAPGYWKDPESTGAVFFQDPELGQVYCTGDLGRLKADGTIEFMGRKDNQVKIRGFRVETGEIETLLLRHPGLREAAVKIHEEKTGNLELCAYVVPDPGAKPPGASVLREYLAGELPLYMIPAHFVFLEALPLTHSGKVDRKALPKPGTSRGTTGMTPAAPHTGIEKTIAGAWKEILNLEEVGIHDNLFDLGGNSYDILQICDKLHEDLGIEIPVIAVFRYPTIAALAGSLQREAGADPDPVQEQPPAPKEKGTDIAVIGMAGRFPGAGSILEFWENLVSGVEAIAFFSEEELAAVGTDPGTLRDPAYVKAKGSLAGSEFFDAAFFQYSPLEAETMDPQLRLLLECAWEALENAGYDSESYPGSIGVYEGNASNFHWLRLTSLQQADPVDTMFLNTTYSTKISYKLNLKGPSMVVTTACSTSLVTLHLACQGLRQGECDLALAGGAAVAVPNHSGYYYQEGNILSPDGHCRAFDGRAGGTVFGSGVGLAVLKRLSAAVADGDFIYAVIKGSAVNNDGRRKVGLTAPSVDGQAEVIRAAHLAAGISPETIGYVETHGTGTILGDPIEMEALKLAFNTEKKQFCAVGAVKANVGHLNNAAGVAGFIKTVLALHHRQIPPSLNLENPNPRVDFENSPFYPATRLIPWQRGQDPLRAGVSSFGIGGTNAHMILEEAPTLEPPPADPDRDTRCRALLLSARSPAALDRATANLAAYLTAHPRINLADAAYTLQVGRQSMKYRKIVMGSSTGEMIRDLTTPQPDQVLSAAALEGRAVFFLFSGQGSQYVNMGLDLYRTEPVFRGELDRCFEILEPLMGYGLRGVLYPDPGHGGAPLGLDQTEVTQPVLFAFEYAMGNYLMRLGLRPAALLGHSIGEYTAACLAGVFSLEEALGLVVLRGKLMQRMPGGAMLSVPLPETQLTPYWDPQLELAAVNSSSLCVVTGPAQAVSSLQNRLGEAGIETRLLHTSHAFHSRSMEPVLEEFRAAAAKVTLNKPAIPYISNVSGEWITAPEARDPGYWARHLRETVRFARGLELLLETENALLLEVGPGKTLATFARQHQAKKNNQVILNLVRHPRETRYSPDSHWLLRQLGQVWLQGVKVNWPAYHGEEKRCRVPLPTYPFERRHFPVKGELLKRLARGESGGARPAKKQALMDWFYAPTWKRALPVPGPGKEAPPGPMNWLIFMDEVGIGDSLAARLERGGHRVTAVRWGEEFRVPEGFRSLVQELHSRQSLPRHILHLWNVTPSAGETREPDEDSWDTGYADRGFYSLLHLARALGNLTLEPGPKIQCTVVTSDMQEVAGERNLFPLKAVVLGAVKVIPREYGYMACRCIDIPGPVQGEVSAAAVEPPDPVMLDHLFREMNREISEPVLAYRNGHCWIRSYEAIRWEKPGEPPPPLRQGGVYLVTGGLGGIGLELAGYLAAAVKARLVLTGRSAFPPREQWPQWVNSHPAAEPVRRKIEKIRQMENQGAEISVFQGDVADPRRMKEIITAVLEQWGPIHGVIHAAGLPGGPVIQRRTREMTESVLAPKIKGTLVLDRLLRDPAPDFFILCSSLAAVLGNAGQVDYCAANNFLDHFALYRSLHQRGPTMSINWDNWQQVGMAAVSGKTREIVTELDHPLFVKHLREEPGASREIFISHFSAARDWFLSEHRVLGKPTLPGTAFLEMVYAAVRWLEHRGSEPGGAGCAVDLEEVYFMAPLVVEENQEKEVRTILQSQDRGFRFSVVSRSTAAGDQWVQHAAGTAVRVPGPASPGNREKPSIEEMESACNREIIDYRPNHEPVSGGMIAFGPRWHNLLRVKRGDHRGIGVQELPRDAAADVTRHPLHPALVDVALHRVLKNEGAYIPFFYKKIGIKAPLPARILSYAAAAGKRTAGQETQAFDVIIMDPEGRILVEIRDYTLRRITPEAPTAHQFVRQQPAPAPAPPAPAPPAPSGNGILPREGIEIFQWVLAGELPQVVVSTVDLRDREQRHRAAGPIRPDPDPQKQDTPLPGFTGRQRPEIKSDYVPPQTEIQERLVRLWQDLLGITPVGIHDDFFELGGDSLKAISSRGRLQKEFAVDVPLSEFFNRPTVNQLGEYLLDHLNEKQAFSIGLAEEKEYYELSSGQKRIYVIQQMNPADTSYNVTPVFKLKGRMQRERAQQVLRTIIRRHETLRTSIPTIAGEPVQRIHKQVELVLEYDSYRRGGREKSPESIIKEFIRPFALDRAPLLRARLRETGAEEYLFMLGYHHIIADGYSQGILTYEFMTLYMGQEPPFLSLQYRDYSQWQNSSRQKQERKKQERFWLNLLAGEVPLLKLPVDFPGSPIRDFAGQSEYFTISPRETALMRELIARNKGVTLYMVLLSIYNILLGKYSGQETILVGAVFAGRPHGDLQNIIGMFTNMLVMRNVPSEHKSAGEFLSEVKENALAAYNNKDYPYEELVRRLNLRSQTMEDPLNAAAFGLVDSRGVGIEPTAAGAPPLPTGAEFNDETLEITPFQVKSGRTNFMLDLLAVEQRNRIEMRFSYSTWRFKPSTIRTMTRHYLEILRQVLECPETRIKDLKISHELSSASSAVGEEEPGDFDFNLS